MKNILKAIALIVCLLLPLSAMAMSGISDSDLANVTGQAGVSINLDVNMNVTIDTIAWGDKDGLGTAEAGGAGWIGLSSLNANGIRVRLRQDLVTGALLGNQTLATNASNAIVTGLVQAYQSYALRGGTALPNTGGQAQLTTEASSGNTYALAVLNAMGALGAEAVSNHAQYVLDATAIGTILAGGADSNEIVPLTINVATDGTHGANITFVRIGLGSLEIGMNTMSATVALGGGATPTLNQQLGSIYMAGLLVDVNGTSYVDIYNDRGTGKQGVTIFADVIIDKITLNTLTWGDSDGFNNHLTTTAPVSNTSGAGYVGLQNTTIQNLSVVGGITIDVATDDGVTAGFKQSGINTTFVRIGFASTAINMGQLDTTAVLSNTQDLTGNVYTLGSIYMKDLAVTVGGSVDIWNKADKDGVVIDLAATINMTLGTVAWGDSDGLTNNTKIDSDSGLPIANNLITGSTTTNQGWVGLKNLTITNLALGGEVTIDVATVAAGNTSTYATGTSFVRIGFNTVNIAMDSMTATVALGAAKTNLNQELGSIYLGGMTTAINGYVDIRAAGTTGQGVIINLGLTPSNVNITSLSWGDSDGVGSAIAAGYVGLRGLAITGLQVAGQISIDVATVVDPTLSAGHPVQYVNKDNLMYWAYATHLMSPTFVHIGLGTGNAADAFGASSLAITVGTLAADVRLDSNPALSTVANGALGSLYLSNMVIKANGWVDIAAH